MYCDSEEAREEYESRLQREDDALLEEQNQTSKRRKDLMKSLKIAEKVNNEKLVIKLTREELAIEEACKEEGSFNAPMLVAWLLKHHQEDPTTLNGLKYLLKHLETGEGCFLMLRHGALQAVMKIHAYFTNDPPIQLLVIKVVRQLLDCNYTRSLVLDEANNGATNLLHMCFKIAHHHMNSASHVEVAAHCITQTARSEVCRQAIQRLNIIAYMINFCKRFSKNPKIIRPTLMLMLWFSTNQPRLEYVCTFLKGVHATLQCMRRHPSRPGVVSPGILFLARAAQNHPESMELILKKNAAALVIESLKVVYNNDAIQLQGLKLLQIIAKTSIGWKQIGAVHAGWQTICQGTMQGDALVHELPGAFQNPGWAIGDTPYLPILERQKITAAKQALSGIQEEPKAAWTAMSLREYMGLSMTGQVLAINTEHHNIYFELLSTLDMLPKLGEERELWFQRVHAYEEENEVKIDDMVLTVQEMRRREAHKKKMDAQLAETGYSDDLGGTVKEVYVNGVKISGDVLTANDADVEETMEGIL
mmetsp:Transcript_31144/g.52069  ORF Transcript_31144/g.52069 Transcript_31144/m.52069 type:complete len:533 (-) Transcript_31144:92-1690(-)